MPRDPYYALPASKPSKRPKVAPAAPKRGKRANPGRRGPTKKPTKKPKLAAHDEPDSQRGPIVAVSNGKRTASGRFGPGNQFAKLADAVARGEAQRKRYTLAQVLDAALTEDQLYVIVMKQLAKAKTGDLDAAKWLVDRKCGKLLDRHEITNTDPLFELSVQVINAQREIAATPADAALDRPAGIRPGLFLPTALADDQQPGAATTG